MVTFQEYIMIIGFKNGFFSLSPFPKEKHFFVLRELELLQRRGHVHDRHVNDFVITTTPLGEAAIRLVAIRFGKDTLSCLTLFDCKPTAFIKHHLLPNSLDAY